MKITGVKIDFVTRNWQERLNAIAEVKKEIKRGLRKRIVAGKILL